MVFTYLFFKDSKKNRRNGNGAILIGLSWTIYFFSKVNDTIFPLNNNLFDRCFRKFDKTIRKEKLT